MNNNKKKKKTIYLPYGVIDIIIQLLVTHNNKFRLVSNKWEYVSRKVFLEQAKIIIKYNNQQLDFVDNGSTIILAKILALELLTQTYRKIICIARHSDLYSIFSYNKDTGYFIDYQNNTKFTLPELIERLSSGLGLFIGSPPDEKLIGIKSRDATIFRFGEPIPAIVYGADREPINLLDAVMSVKNCCKFSRYREFYQPGPKTLAIVDKAKIKAKELDMLIITRDPIIHNHKL